MNSAAVKKREIKRVAVIGSGIMGTGIAAHLANCGIPSLVLKVTPIDPSERGHGKGGFGAAKKAALLKTKPSPIYDRSVVDQIDFGSIEEDAREIESCDWICETVKEDLSAKNKVFQAVAKHRSPGSIVSTNTSGIALSEMAKGMDTEMREHFLGTHFFNPPRYLRLVELVPGPNTRTDVLATMVDFGENVMGKRVIHAKDTPNFVANRAMAFLFQYMIHEMTRLGFRIEEIDALTGTLIGHAASATFRTADLVGLDTVTHAVSNVYSNCPNDEQRRLFVPPEWLRKMLEKGRYGEKSGCGFYKKTSEKDANDRSIVLALDPETLEYRTQIHPQFECIEAAKRVESVEDQVRIMHMGTDRGSKFVWDAFAHLAAYVGNRIPEITGDIVNIDSAVKWGFGWELGVFETWDTLGFKYVCDRMVSDGLELPQIARNMLDRGALSFYSKTPQGRRSYFDLAAGAYAAVPSAGGLLLLSEITQSGGIVRENPSASLIDLGDGILCAEFHSKMNTVDAGVAEVLEAGVDMVNLGQFDGMVIGNQGKHFCVGANLTLVLDSIKDHDWDRIRMMVNEFQRINMSMRFCRGPVVSAPHHLSLGGAIEMSQHAARVVYAGETYGGLVEMGVGLIPGAGGTKEMLRRALACAPPSLEEGNPFPYVRRAFESICLGKVSTSGPELIELGYLSDNDILCENVDQQIRRAKDVCRGMVVAGYKPPRPAKMTALGEPVRSVFRVALFNLHESGFASEHDVAIAMHVARVMTGGDRLQGAKMTEHDVLELECEAFLSLCGTQLTRQRIEHTLETGKPLRN